MNFVLNTNPFIDNTTESTTKPTKMKKIKEMLHHGHNDNAPISDASSSNTYTTSTTTAAVPEREIIGDKIDRSGTYEQKLPKHSHLPAESATFNNTTGLTGANLGRASTQHIPSSSTTTTQTTSFTPIGSTSASHHSSISRELPKSSMVTQPAPVLQQAAVVTPVVATQTMPVQQATVTRAPTVVSAPVQMERVEKPVVIQERVLPIQKEEIQPVIHREREQLDVKQITQQMHETKIQPTMVQQRSLAPEVRPTNVMRSAPIAPNLVQPSVQVEAARQSTVVHAPIVEETVKKTIIEEVQPVLQRDVVAPTVIQEVKPIYEKIVEAPHVYRETLPTRELGVQGATSQFQQGFGLAQPQLSTANSWNNGQQLNSGFNGQQQFNNSGLTSGLTSGLNNGQQQFNNTGLNSGLGQQREYKEELNSGMLGQHSALHTGKVLREEDKLKTFDSSNLNTNQSTLSSGTQYPTSH